VVGVVSFLRPRPYKPTAEAASWYEKGSDALRNGAFLQRQGLDQAIARDPKFALAHARLPSLERNGLCGQAKDEMLKVQSLVPNRSQLATTDSLYLEAINATLTRDYDCRHKGLCRMARLNRTIRRYTWISVALMKRMTQIKKAIKSYVEAATRAPSMRQRFCVLGSSTHANSISNARR